MVCIRGMYQIAKAMGRLIDKLGIDIHLNTEVKRIVNADCLVKGIETLDGKSYKADAIISNMETIPAYKYLLDESISFTKRLDRFEPACSGLVLDLGLKRRYPQLAHHNFFISGNQKEHFRSVFTKKILPKDPTIYLVAASRTDPKVAPEGCEAIKILPHIPYINEKKPYTQNDYLDYKELIIDKLERMGLDDLRSNIIFEHVLTPLDIQEMYYSNKGSIYGVVCDRFKNLALKTPKQSKKYPNLFFTGGSVNPGGGMPMVALCGQHVCDRLIKYDRADI